MAANTAPIFGRNPRASWSTSNVTAANTAKDGASGTIYEVFTAGVDGAYVTKLIVRPRGTNVATVMRVFINNGSATTSAANNTLVAELSLIATTGSETAAIIGTDLPLNLPLPAGYKLFVTIGTGVSAGFSVAAVGADY